MNRAHTEMLERITVGELAPDDPEVLAARRTDAAFDTALVDTLAVLDGLDAARTEREAVLFDAAARVDAPGESSVAAFVRGRTTSGGSTRWGSTRGRLVRVALAAAILLAIVIPLTRREDSGGGGLHVPLGEGGELVAESPVGPNAQFERFAWSAAVTGGWFELRVFDEAGEPVLRGASGRIEGREWTPDSDAVDQWPDEIEWELRWYDGNGVQQASEFFSASRR